MFTKKMIRNATLFAATFVLAASAYAGSYGKKKADIMAHHHHHGAMPKMDGMATPEQMAALAASNGTDFDRMFLELMITHHEGAITMVDDLLELPGSAYDPTLFDSSRWLRDQA